jgi:hypothetical protein
MAPMDAGDGVTSLFSSFWQWLQTAPQGPAAFVGTLIGSSIGVVTSIITGTMTLVGVFIGSRLSYGRSIKEKFWDVRREAYTGILSELAEVDRITKGADVWMATMPGEYLNSDWIQKDSEKIENRMGVVWRKYSDDHLVMSDEFVRIFERFISKFDEGYDPNVAFDRTRHLHQRKIITEHRALLLAQARKELARE